MLTIKLDGTYRKKLLVPQKNGSYLSDLRWRYKVSGTPEELSDYKASDERIVTDETGTHLLFSTRYLGDNAGLSKSVTTKKYFAQSNPMIDKLQSMVNQYGGSIGDALATMAAAEIIKGMGNAGSAPVGVTATPNPDPDAVKNPADVNAED